MHPSKLRTSFNSFKCNVARSISVTSQLMKKGSSPKVKSTHLKSWKEIPGPSCLPFVGQIHHLFPGGSLHDLQGKTINTELYKRYGPIVKLKFALTPLVVFLTDPESIQQVYRTEYSAPHRPGLITLDYYRRHYNKLKYQSLGHIGLVTEQGEKWKSFRKMVNPVILQPKVVKTHSNAIDEVAKDMILRFKSLRDQNNMIENIPFEMKLWALESICLIALGCRINCFDKDLKENSYARKLIHYSVEVVNIGASLDLKPPIWKYFPTKSFKNAMNVYEGLEATSLHFVRMAKEELKNNKDNAERGILERLLEIDENVAVIMACDLLLGGIDTISNTLSFTLYLLAKNQDKQRRLRESLVLNERKYLKACIRESMRMMPVVNSNARIATREYNIQGYKIPKDSFLIFNHHLLSLDEKQYPRPNEFIPERWIFGKEEPLYHGNAHPFATLPFGFGVRTCIGRRIAELELETMLINLLEEFSIQWRGQPPVIRHSHLNCVSGLNFVFNDLK